MSKIIKNMLTIIDTNTNAKNLTELENLKKEFYELLSPTVQDGEIIIICDFPACGNISSNIDYLIFFHLKQGIKNNYFRLENSYIKNFILIIKKIELFDLNHADEQFLYSSSGSFDYKESSNSLNREVENYLEKYLKAKCLTIYQIISDKPSPYSNLRILINKQLTAKYLLKSVIEQFYEKYNGTSVTSFNKDIIKNGDDLLDMVTRIIESSNYESKYGILTKKKLDKLSSSSNILEEIYQNVGKSISIIKGKPGTGKTFLITRIIDKHAKNKHTVRFLTFNQLLVFEIKQLLRNLNYHHDSKIAISSVHQFFYRLSEKLGLSLIFNQSRLKELLYICEIRVDKFRSIYEAHKQDFAFLEDEKSILFEIQKKETNKVDFDEFKEFARFFVRYHDKSSFDRIRDGYLNEKIKTIKPALGRKTFLEDYYKFLESIFLAITDTEKFYKDFDIANRYDLLSTLYNINNEDAILHYDQFEQKVNSLKKTANWSKLVIIDEAQDFHVLEKEILFHFIGSQNLIVTDGGKEQLVRHSKILPWQISLNKQIPSRVFPLYDISFRQKANIVEFINAFALEYGMQMKLKTSNDSMELGKIILDFRPKKGLINDLTLKELLRTGNINGCSNYESLLILIPSKNYTTKKIDSAFIINETDHIIRTEVSRNRQIIDLDKYIEQDVFLWNGVVEDKSHLKIPSQFESRVIHYESCRGLEAWSCACISLDEYFEYKSKSSEAEQYLADDLFLEEEDRRDRYAAVWCLMAFSRPIDTLYIHLENANSRLSKILLSIASKCTGVLTQFK